MKLSTGCQHKCIFLLAALSSCSTLKPPAATEGNVQDYATHLAALCQGSVLSDKDLQSLRTVISQDICNGDQDKAADLIVTDGAWHRQIWYKYAEEEFADVWRRKATPITICASPQSVAALKHLMRSGITREARVASAIALAPVDPKLSMPVLKAEYANFEIRPVLIPAVQPPLGTGECLVSMGVQVIPEVVTVDEFRRILAKHPLRPAARVDAERLAKAGNLFNHRLRTHLLRNECQAFQDLGDVPSLSDLAFQCYEAAHDEPASLPTTRSTKR